MLRVGLGLANELLGIKDQFLVLYEIFENMLPVNFDVICQLCVPIQGFEQGYI